MNKHTHPTANDMGTLAEDARALIAATADVAGETVGVARRRLSAALANARDRAVGCAKVADEAVHEHPYQAIAIGIGLGAVIGLLFACRSKRDAADED
jgi:ElaB/YqjD/DUF883 family membrane-anchored ribosome-binding protein